MIFQDPMSALNPVMRIGRQIMEPLLEHCQASRKAAKQLTIDMLKKVGVPAAARRFDDYPFNFSGGMRQRVLIAMALVLNPKILLADEPTTALDVTIQDQILKLILSLQQEFNLSVIMVSHDLGIIAQTCDRVAVMYAGQIMEISDRESIFANPKHPYTQALIDSIPGEKKMYRLKSIEGAPPFLAKPPPGCRFHPRCPFLEDGCKSAPYNLREVATGHYSACIRDKFL
jgi:oligopeptide/dipeptide ABC transporter ATP-binding protein